MGRLDEPELNGTVVFGNMLLRGWALATSGIERIEVYVDDMFVGKATYGYLRPDVADAYPEFPNADRSEYRFDCWEFAFPVVEKNYVRAQVAEHSPSTFFASPVKIGITK